MQYNLKTMSVHCVRPQLDFGRTWVNFVQPMSDDQLLLTALQAIRFQLK